MNLFLKKIIKISIFILIILTVFVGEAVAKVYVYEVTTATTTFRTASKLAPDTFLYYNGGYDVIHNLKILAVYKDEEWSKALKDFNLEENNSNTIIHAPVPRNIPRKPYYWWR